MAKPTKLPEWASGGSADVTEPSAGEKALGWEAGKTAPAGWMNWIQELVYDWFVWVDERFSDGATADETTINNPTGGAELLRVSATNGTSFMDQDDFRAYYDGTDNFLYFGSNDYITFDVSTGDIIVVVNGAEKIRMGASGVVVDGDANFELSAGADAHIQFDALDLITYDRSANEFLFKTASATRLYVDAARTKVEGYLEVTSNDSVPVSNINELHFRNLVTAQCRVTGGGTPVVSSGSYNINTGAITSTGVGIYTVTLDTATPTGTPMACVNDSSGVGKVAKVTQLTSTTYQVSTFISSTGAASHQDFNFFIVGS